ncbi:hypothetical protein AgCh_037490 [Apium graveolens]
MQTNSDQQEGSEYCAAVATAYSLPLHEIRSLSIEDNESANLPAADHDDDQALEVVVVGLCGQFAVTETKAYIKVTKLIREEKDLDIVKATIKSSLPLYKVRGSSTTVQHNRSAIVPVRSEHNDETLKVVVQQL